MARHNNKHFDEKNNKKEQKKIIYTNVFKVKETTYLLDFLLLKMNTSRNVCKTLLAKNQVLVNGVPERQFNLVLAKEDEVAISKYSVEGPVKKVVKKNRVEKPKIDIIYEDEDFIAINKPEGVLAVENEKEKESCYLYVSEYLKMNGKGERPFVIHRIDKETSGVLVFAKNPYIQSKLRLEWNDFVVLREYIAVVSGVMDKKSDRIICNLLEDKNNMVYVARGKDGKQSITNYEVLKTDNKNSMLKVVIETGRKNQIRVVLKSLGHPILGDLKYGDGSSPLIKRLALHASKLVFKHPFKNKEISLLAKTPSSFNVIK